MSNYIQLSLFTLILKIDAAVDKWMHAEITAVQRDRQVHLTSGQFYEYQQSAV